MSATVQRRIETAGSH